MGFRYGDAWDNVLGGVCEAVSDLQDVALRRVRASASTGRYSGTEADTGYGTSARRMRSRAEAEVLCSEVDAGD